MTNSWRGNFRAAACGPLGLVTTPSHTCKRYSVLSSGRSRRERLEKKRLNGAISASCAQGARRGSTNGLGTSSATSGTPHLPLGRSRGSKEDTGSTEIAIELGQISVYEADARADLPAGAIGFGCS